MSELQKLSKKIIKDALIEDGYDNDITSNCCIDNQIVKFSIIAKEDIILCGIDIVKITYETILQNSKFSNCEIKIINNNKDGQFIKKNNIICHGSGSARLILAGERVMLNLIQHLCGIATKTSKYVNLLNNENIKILDTRKTIASLRSLQKYSVKVGGGENHRYNLSDKILIKDNHIAINGSIEQILKKFTNKKYEIECENISQVKKTLKFNPAIIMLDNMNISQIKLCASIIRENKPNTQIEVSGGITIKNIYKYQNLDIDYISIGDLTHSINASDISLEIC